MPLDKPTFMPDIPATRTATADVLEHREVPGISFHRDGDGVIFYYDRPRVYVAWYEGEMVVATLTNEDYEGPPERARGWDQTFLIAVTPEFLRRVYESELPFRALYDQPDAMTWFVHEDWRHRGDRTWDRRIQVFDGVPVPENVKPDVGVFLDPAKNRPQPSVQEV